MKTFLILLTALALLSSCTSQPTIQHDENNVALFPVAAEWLPIVNTPESYGWKMSKPVTCAGPGSSNFFYSKGDSVRYILTDDVNSKILIDTKGLNLDAIVN